MLIFISFCNRGYLDQLAGTSTDLVRPLALKITVKKISGGSEEVTCVDDGVGQGS